MKVAVGKQKTAPPVRDAVLRIVVTGCAADSALGWCGGRGLAGCVETHLQARTLAAGLFLFDDSNLRGLVIRGGHTAQRLLGILYLAVLQKAQIGLFEGFEAGLDAAVPGRFALAAAGLLGR